MISPKLPELAYSVKIDDKSLVIVKRGQIGFYPYGPPSDFNEQIKDQLNARMGVSKAQAEAMTFGSMFGWSLPGADPANYSDDGKLLPLSKVA